MIKGLRGVFRRLTGFKEYRVFLEMILEGGDKGWYLGLLGDKKFYQAFCRQEIFREIKSVKCVLEDLWVKTENWVINRDIMW